MNWQLKDLVLRLKKQHVMNRQLMVGDIVVSDSGCWQVAKILPEPNGFLTVLDENENGIINEPPDKIRLIINRNCIGR